jgi:hypothetical protein
VFPGIHSGQIVDDVNAIAFLEKALFLYAIGQCGHTPLEGIHR